MKRLLVLGLIGVVLNCSGCSALDPATYVVEDEATDVDVLSLEEENSRVRFIAETPSYLGVDYDVSELGENWQNNLIFIEEELVNLSEVTAQYFFDRGYEVNTRYAPVELEAGSYTVASLTFDKDDFRFDAQLFNPSSETLPLEECHLSSFTVAQKYNSYYDGFVFTKGLQFGVDADTIKDYLGVDAVVTTKFETVEYFYREENYKTIKVTVDAKSGVVIGIDLEFMADYL